ATPSPSTVTLPPTSCRPATPSPSTVTLPPTINLPATPSPSTVTLPPTSSCPANPSFSTTTNLPAAPSHSSTLKVLRSRQTQATCCFCNLRLNKKNLKTHIKRKHSSSNPDITARSHIFHHGMHNLQGPGAEA
ncbi:hypothetical protein SKAU_G00307410, partial [Synaphobranchus kaupii]